MVAEFTELPGTTGAVVSGDVHRCANAIRQWLWRSQRPNCWWWEQVERWIRKVADRASIPWRKSSSLLQECDRHVRLVVSQEGQSCKRSLGWA